MAAPVRGAERHRQLGLEGRGAREPRAAIGVVSRPPLAEAGWPGAGASCGGGATGGAARPESSHGCLLYIDSRSVTCGQVVIVVIIWRSVALPAKQCVAADRSCRSRSCCHQRGRFTHTAAIVIRQRQLVT